MSQFVALLVGGLSLGAVYALVALGFVIIFKATGVLNFAQGSMLLLAAYVIAQAQAAWGFGAAFLIGTLTVIVVALVIQRGLLERLQRRGTGHVPLAILTLGVDIVLLAALVQLIATDVYGLNNPWGAGVVRLGGIVFPQARIAGFAVALTLIGLFLLAFRYTKSGIALRASADDGEAAALMGIRHAQVSAAAWVVAAVLASVAAVFLVAFPSPGLDATTGFIALKAFPAAVLGGLDSTHGALVGGLSIGVVESLALGYDSELAPFLGSGFGSVAPWLVLLLVLLFRPSGLFGSKDVARV